MVLSTASSFGVGLPWHLPAGPSTGGPPPAALQPASPLPVPKPQPTQTQPQQLPPHPFAAAAAQYSSTRALLGALSTPAPGDVPAASCSAVERHEGGLLHMTAPLAASLPQSDTTASFSRQLSSPARLRHSDLVQVRGLGGGGRMCRSGLHQRCGGVFRCRLSLSSIPGWCASTERTNLLLVPCRMRWPQQATFLAARPPATAAPACRPLP